MARAGSSATIELMPEATERNPPGPRAAPKSASATVPTAVTRIAVGVDGFPEGRDATALGEAIRRAVGAELMLVAVQPEPLLVMPPALDWKSLHEQAQATVAQARDTIAPGARVAVETDLSVPRALQRVVEREHRDLLVVGSSRHGPEGRVRIGKRTRQLLGHFDCALAVAPRGMHERAGLPIASIGVGYDGESESQAAIALAGAIAQAGGAELHVCCVVDDRPPTVGWGQVWLGNVIEDWREAVQEHLTALCEQAGQSAGQTGAAVEIEGVKGRPAAALLALSERVDLLVIGSRRWGPASRVLLGSTGEALMHDAACPVLAVPRPAG
jgi:nucleotide-binding universal stress UspA family protein